MDLNDTIKEIFNKPDLEYDLLNNERIVAKCLNGPQYCRDLYGALCNNRFFYGDKEWTCSWRVAGGIVADIIKDGTYMDWYCSGSAANNHNGYVSEGEVTSEITNDLLNLGWVHKPYEPRLESGLYKNEW